MARAQIAYLNRKDVPARKSLQAAIHQLGFKLALDDSYGPFETKGRPFHKPLILTALQLAGSGFVYWFCYQLATANPTSRGMLFAA